MGRPLADLLTPGRRQRLDALAGMWLPVIVVLVLILFFTVATDAFMTLRNLRAISGQASTLLLACLGATFVILMGSIDLSVGAMVLLVGAITVKAINALGLSIEAVGVAIVIGTLLGSINGFIFAYGRIPSFVVTLGTLSVFTGAAWEILQGRALRYDSFDFEDLAIGQVIPYVQNIALFAVGAWIIMVFVCFRTRFGRYMYIIGGGEAVARTTGIPVRRYKVIAFALSGMMAGLAGALAVARLGAAGPTLGQDLLLNTLAAIVVGGTSLSGGVGGVHRNSDRRLDHRVARQRLELDGGQSIQSNDGQGCGRYRCGSGRPRPQQEFGNEVRGRKG